MAPRKTPKKNKIDLLITRLDTIEKRLDRMIDLMEIQNNRSIQIDPNPWPYTLMREAQTAEDCDNNGLVYGMDFIFDENLENHPQALQGIARQFKENQLQTRELSWEEYHDSLPDGPFKEKLGPWMRRLGERLVKPSEESLPVSDDGSD